MTSEPLELGRIGKLGVGTVALGIGLGVATEVSAGIVNVAMPNGPVVLHKGDSADFDLNHDGHLDFMILDTASHNYLGAIFQIDGLVTNDFRNMIDFVLHGYHGASIVPAIGPFNSDTWGSVFDVFNSSGTGGLAPNDRALIGLLFEIPGSTPHYGALEVEGQGTGNDGTLTVFGGFYDTVANQPIPSVPVPAPGGLATLALGAASIAAWKLRRRSKGE
jgi:hypothetical protein